MKIHWLIKNFVLKKCDIYELLYIGVNVRHNVCPFEGNCLTPIQQFSVYHGENKLIFNEMIMRSTLY